MSIATDALEYLLAMEWLEAGGLVTGLLCVLLLIRQNIWNWPIGLAYALISLAVFYKARLYADLGMHIYYAVMNAYGWWYWTAGQRNTPEVPLPVTHVPARVAGVLGGVFVAATAAIGYGLDNHTNADLPYWDTAANVLSFIAMWMTARKYLENWYVWFVVDVALTAIYLYKGIDFYAILYGVYLGMAVAGWWAWRRSMALASAN